jgi:hypothetical protein
MLDISKATPDNGMHPTAHQRISHLELVRSAVAYAAGVAGRYVALL